MWKNPGNKMVYFMLSDGRKQDIQWKKTSISEKAVKNGRKKIVKWKK